MKKCLIFPVSMRGVGLLYHFTELALALNKKYINDESLDLYIISENGEQNEGLWDKLKKEIPERQIYIYKSSSEFTSFVESKLNDKSYSKVIYLTQGILQFLQSVPLKRKYFNKLWLYSRLNSFKHGTKYRGPLTFFLSIIFKRYGDFINFQCEYTSRIFRNSKSIFRAGKAGIIPLGLSVEEDIAVNDTKLVSMLDSNKKISIVYLANFHKHKRHMDLITFMKDSLQKNQDLNLILLGEGAYFDKCKELTKRMNLTNQIHFPGRVHRKHIPYILRRADLSIVFSEVETFGHNILEPLFYGTPVVSSNVGIAANVIKDYRNGILLNSTSKEEFIFKVQPFLSKKNLSLNELSKKNIREIYKWDHIVNQYHRMISNIY